jgi:hypothetical protein
MAYKKLKLNIYYKNLFFYFKTFVRTYIRESWSRTIFRLVINNCLYPNKSDNKGFKKGYTIKVIKVTNKGFFFILF